MHGYVGRLLLTIGRVLDKARMVSSKVLCTWHGYKLADIAVCTRRRIDGQTSSCLGIDVGSTKSFHTDEARVWP